MDPSLVMYKAMFPFLVSLIEFMFKESFIIMIRYDDKAQGIIAKENFKVPLDDVFKISSGKMLIEEVIAGNFTFQNLGQVNKAYKTYLNIDIAKTLSKKRNSIFRTAQNSQTGYL